MDKVTEDLPLPEQPANEPVSLIGFENLTPEQQADVMRQFLRQSLKTIFTGYGDHRVRLNKDDETEYGTRGEPFPQENSVGSCTGETSRPKPWQAAEAALNRLRTVLETEGYTRFLEVYNEMVQEVDQRFLKVMGLPEGAVTVDCLSGTEAELVYFLFGVTWNIIQKETGSGTFPQASGRHSSHIDWRGAKLGKGEKINGLEGIAEAMELAVREDDGKLVSPEAMSHTAETLIKQYLLDYPEGCIGLHATPHLKTGEASLSLEKTLEIAKRYGDRVLPIVDAAQMRLSPEDISQAVKDGFIVAVTGSKFPGGPIFSGKVIMNQERAQQLHLWVRANGIPKGLKAYFTYSDFARILDPEDNIFPKVPNVPLLLKWIAALDTMERFYAVPKESREALVNFVSDIILEFLVAKEDVARGIRKPFPHLFLTRGAKVAYRELAGEKKAQFPPPPTNTITAFHVEVEGKDFLNRKKLKEIYWLLNHDLSELARTDGERQILAAICHLGQPVQEGEEPASLRIAPSMEWFNEIFANLPQDLFQEGKLGAALITDERVVDIAVEKVTTTIRGTLQKAELLAQMWPLAREYYRKLHPPFLKIAPVGNAYLTMEVERVIVGKELLDQWKVLLVPYQGIQFPSEFLRGFTREGFFPKDERSEQGLLHCPVTTPVIAQAMADIINDPALSKSGGKVTHIERIHDDGCIAQVLAQSHGIKALN